MAEGSPVLTETIQYSEETDFSHPNFSIDEVQSALYEHGVAVISHVISDAECDAHVTQIRDWLATFGDAFPENFSSLIHQYNIAHLQPMWRARLQVKAVFSQLWGTDKLMSSMDAMAIGRPPEDGQTTYGLASTRAGLHLDQGRQRQGLHAYQGALYLEEALADDWCFVVMDGSHKYLADFFSCHDAGRSEHRKLSEDEISWYEQQGCAICRVAVPKGGMVLWDSRTVHAGAPPVQGRRNPGRWRHVLFVCQTPAVWATKKDLEIKKDAYENLRISHHWASNGVQNFEYNKHKHDITVLPDIARTDDAKLLAGVKLYNFNDGRSNGPKMKPKWR